MSKMGNLISPKYQMQLVDRLDLAIWAEYSSYKKVKHYIKKWHESDGNGFNYWENFEIVEPEENKIDLLSTLHSMNGEILIRIAIDMGIDTPDFIPSIPVFRNELKTSYETASSTFERAFKEIEVHPDTAIGLANSALESVIKEILKDDRVKAKVNANNTLYKLTSEILKVFHLFPKSDLPEEIKTIGSSLMSINQSIEKIRSEKTVLHGKTEEDYIVKDPIYAYFVVNSVATVGLFLNSFYHKKFPKPESETDESGDTEDLPF